MMNMSIGDKIRGMIRMGFYTVIRWNALPSSVVKHILHSNSTEKKMLP